MEYHQILINLEGVKTNGLRCVRHAKSIQKLLPVVVSSAWSVPERKDISSVNIGTEIVYGVTNSVWTKKSFPAWKVWLARIWKERLELGKYGITLNNTSGTQGSKYRRVGREEISKSRRSLGDLSLAIVRSIPEEFIDVHGLFLRKYTLILRLSSLATCHLQHQIW